MLLLDIQSGASSSRCSVALRRHGRLPSSKLVHPLISRWREAAVNDSSLRFVVGHKYDLTAVFPNTHSGSQRV